MNEYIVTITNYWNEVYVFVVKAEDEDSAIAEVENLKVAVKEITKNQIWYIKAQPVLIPLSKGTSFPVLVYEEISVDEE